MNYIIQSVTNTSHVVRRDKADSIEELRNILQELHELEYPDNDITISVEDKDTIAVSWSIEDVKEVAKHFSDDECRRVLQLAKEEHDATLGINWDVLREWAIYVENEK